MQHSKFKNRILNTIVFSIVSMLFWQCSNQPKAMPESVSTNDSILMLTSAQVKYAFIETAILRDKNIATVIRLNGKIDVPPQSLVSVSVPLGGYLKSTRLLSGMHVSKGEVIAVLEDPQYVRLQQEYLQTKSKLHFAELNFQRQKALNESQASSDKTTQEAQSEMENQRILLRALAQQLKLISVNPDNLTEANITKSVPVYCTINGYVSKVNVNIGKYVNPSEVLFELIDPADIHLNLKAYEKDVNKLQIGQNLIAFSNANPTKKYAGKIILISKDISNEGISEIHCHFEQYDNSLLPGMYMNAEIETHSALSQALPEESIVNFEGKDYVFERKDTLQFVMLSVLTGLKENGYIQIQNGSYLLGKDIVVKNAYTLLMALKNKVTDE
ncbi:MAG: efflux RND transporter periplasmic adaptor subunit [Bacteroidetes bacterium]|nr:efflux RND transporter periplasmic adaptor subunit [Bacteroidota bacterium]